MQVRFGLRAEGPSGERVAVIADEVTCRQFVELITDYFEGTLAPRTLGRVEEHLVMCDWCTTYTEQMQSTISSLRALTETASAGPPESVLSALRAKREARG
jgi:predicted anti-sigma-YlaC factor YlaD